MKVAYIFNQPNAANYKLGTMILPQLEADDHGVDVAGMFFFDNNTYILREGDPTGERLAKVAKKKGILLMMCDQCALQRKLAEGEPRNVRSSGTVEGVHVGCFPDLYKALEPAGVDQVITL
ncbi:MAG: sulfur reduction protein DsrE [Bacteroidetes bacterium]|jgi:sulfur relay (sulfurtransferase) complex TusBCD TusD component (DsrE family)|nr:sulfur reduction protein DsrE [Bacteroidota bacterium]